MSQIINHEYAEPANVGTANVGVWVYTVIRRYEDQAFNDMSEESGQNYFESFVMQKPLPPVPSRGIFEQAETKWKLNDPCEVTSD